METDVVWNIDEQSVIGTLEKAALSLEHERDHPVLDFSSMRRIDSRCLRALQEFAHRAEDKKIKATLRGVNVNIYKALKLAGLTRCFSFVN